MDLVVREERTVAAELDAVEGVLVAGGILVVVGGVTCVETAGRVQAAVDAGDGLGSLADTGDDLVLGGAGEVDVEGLAVGVGGAGFGAGAHVVAVGGVSGQR